MEVGDIVHHKPAEANAIIVVMYGQSAVIEYINKPSSDNYGYEASYEKKYSGLFWEASLSLLTPILDGDKPRRMTTDELCDKLIEKMEKNGSR